MYVGSTDSEGLHHLVWEAIDNAVDEVENGNCRRIVVILHADRRVTVADDGRGIPCDVHPQTGLSALETVFIKLHAGGKFSPTSYAFAGGLHGVGSSVINALSSKLHVSVLRDGKLHEISFSRGRLVSPLTVRTSPSLSRGDSEHVGNPRTRERANEGEKAESEGDACSRSEGNVEAQIRAVEDYVCRSSSSSVSPFSHLFRFPSSEAKRSPPSGTCLTFEVDREIFGEDARLDGRKIEQRLRALAYLHPTASLRFFEMPRRRREGTQTDEEDSQRFDPRETEGNKEEHIRATESAQPTKTAHGEEETEGHTATRAVLFREPGGLDSYIRHLSANLPGLFSDAPVISINGSHPSSGLLLSVRLFFSSQNSSSQNASSPSSENASSPSSENASSPSSPFASSRSAAASPLSPSSVSSSDFFLSFVNSIPTPEGGVHVEGIRAALSRAVQRLLRLSDSRASAFSKSPSPSLSSLSKKDGKRGKGAAGEPQNAHEKSLNIPGEFLREGLVGVVSLKMREAEFEGQTKKKLGNKKVRGIVEELVTDALLSYFERHPQNLQKLLQKAAAARAAAAAAKAARDFARAKQQTTSLHLTLLPGKLSDCSPTNARERLSKELFIVEGESAAGSAKQARDRRTQAILPLRGKILNVEKLGNFGRIFENEELKALVAALGISMTKAGEVRADLEGLRYSRVIILTDADVDGAHIRSLLLTFFFRLQPELFRQSRIFVACPPLFKISHFPVPRKLLQDATAAFRKLPSPRAASTRPDEAKAVDDAHDDAEAQGDEDEEEREDESDEGGRGAKRLVTETYVWSDEEVKRVFEVLRTHRESRERERRVPGKRMRGVAADAVLSGGVKPERAAREQDRDDGRDRERGERGEQEQEEGEEGQRGDTTVPGLLEGEADEQLSLPGVTLQRFKGLGEMQPEQLRRTTMSPVTRILKRISVADAEAAAAAVASLMGDDVDARKKIIFEANRDVFVEQLDV
ncbi:UNVERIFIED_CONTAM: ATPase/histidine kinase/DNA gyrase B/HSP90 domain-containing protein [Hammondia hammondi]|eukprot:XP_008886082.1 ATPase/histidine kinase/DNA gyrase B/HSP90 domain-containing protein [Hammondia hammondi]